MAVLQLKQEEDEGGLRCPSCGAVMPTGAIICIECGFDTRSGRQHGVEAGPDRKKWIFIGAGALVLLAVVLVLRVALSSGSSEVTTIPAPPPPVVEAPPAPVAPAPAPEPAPVVAQTPVAETNVVVEEAAPPPDPDAIAEEQRPLMRAELDRVAPLLMEGEEADLRLTRGLVVRGTLVDRNETGVVLVSEDTGTNVVEFAALDRTSRVRIDPAFRDQFLEARLRQHVQRIVGAGSTNGAPQAP